jgi:hypothetical protein
MHSDDDALQAAGRLQAEFAGAQNYCGGAHLARDAKVNKPAEIAQNYCIHRKLDNLLGEGENANSGRYGRMPKTRQVMAGFGSSDGEKIRNRL